MSFSKNLCNRINIKIHVEITKFNHKNPITKVPCTFVKLFPDRDRLLSDLIEKIVEKRSGIKYQMVEIIPNNISSTYAITSVFELYKCSIGLISIPSFWKKLTTIGFDKVLLSSIGKLTFTESLITNSLT